eukprot:2055191-Prymnesium_polylepis.1
MAVDGVSHSAVDVASQQVIVSGHAELSALKAAIEGSGKFSVFAQPPTHVGPAAGRRLVRLLVADMVCNGCKGKVELALQMLGGVDSVEVNLDVHRVSIHGTAEPAAMLSAVSAA